MPLEIVDDVDDSDVLEDMEVVDQKFSAMRSGTKTLARDSEALLLATNKVS